MNKSDIVIIEPDDNFAPLLESVLESYGFDAIRVVSSLEHTNDGDVVLGEGEDVLQKPISLGRLMQNLHMIIHRDDKSGCVTLGPFSLDRIANILMKGDGKAIKITEKERDILLYLKEKAPATVSRQDLLEQVWGYGENINTHTLETHIYRLRQKIEENASEPDLLKTEADGYRLEI